MPARKAARLDPVVALAPNEAMKLPLPLLRPAALAGCATTSPVPEPSVEPPPRRGAKPRRRTRRAVSADWWQRVRLAGAAAARRRSARAQAPISPSPPSACARPRRRCASPARRCFRRSTSASGTSRARRGAATGLRDSSEASERDAERELRDRPVGPQCRRRARRRSVAARDALRPRDGAPHADRRRRDRLFRGAVAARAPRGRAREPRHRRARARAGAARARATARSRRSMWRARKRRCSRSAPRCCRSSSRSARRSPRSRCWWAACRRASSCEARSARRPRGAARSAPGCRPSSSCAGPTSRPPRRSSPRRMPTSLRRAPRFCPRSSSPDRPASRAARCSPCSAVRPRALALAASILQPIFDGGRLRGQVALAESRERELVESYRKAILAALADVESALAAASRLAQREALQGAGAGRARAKRCGLPRCATARARTTSCRCSMRSARSSPRRTQLAQVRLERLAAAVALYQGARRRLEMADMGSDPIIRLSQRSASSEL